MANPVLAVKITFSKADIEGAQRLLDVFMAARLCKPHFDKDGHITAVTLYPPKHVVRYNVWAESLTRYCLGRGIPSIVVRPLQSPEQVPDLPLRDPERDPEQRER
jgi:hypothetical protein